MGNQYSKKWVFAIFILSIIILYIYLGNAIFELNEWVYSLWGDAFKNYYHIVFSAQSSQGFWLNQVNYPFGENLFFLDAQIVLTKFLQHLGLQNYTLGFINALPLLSLPVTACFVFLIQREFNIPLIHNVCTTILITFLSPQIHRMTGHFALGYTCFIPAIIYLFFKIKEYAVLSYSLIFLTIIIFSFLHPYYLLLGIVLVFSFIPKHIIDKKYSLILVNLLVIISAVIILKLTLYLSDPVLDRPENPFGIWAYRSTFAGVFYPSIKPLAAFFRQFISYKNPTFESYAYVGVLGFPVLLSTIFLILKSFWKKKPLTGIFESKQFLYLFFAVLIIWIFALYYPLKIIIDPVLELIPALKQFRSIGRFGWIFYYVFSIFISLQLVHLYQYFKNKYLAKFVLLIIVSLWFLDMNGNMNWLQNKISSREYISVQSSFINQKNNKILLLQKNFDCILALPIYHIGSEIENYEGEGLSVMKSFIVSEQINVPIISTYSSRVSKVHFETIKELKNSMDFSVLFQESTKILLVVYNKNIPDNAKDLLNKSELILSDGEIDYYEYNYIKPF